MEHDTHDIAALRLPALADPHTATDDARPTVRGGGRRRRERDRLARRRRIRRRGRRIAPPPGFHLPRARIHAGQRGPMHCRR